MKKTMILLFWLVAGVIALAQSPLYETSSSSTRSEHKLEMTGSSQWSLTPVSSSSYRSSVGQSHGVGSSSLVSIGAGLPQATFSGGQMPQVQFGKGVVGNGELVSDPTQAIGPRRITGGNSGGGSGPDTPDDPWKTPIGDMAWQAVLACMAVVALVRELRKKKRA